MGGLAILNSVSFQLSIPLPRLPIYVAAGSIERLSDQGSFPIKILFAVGLRTQSDQRSRPVGSVPTSIQRCSDASRPTTVHVRVGV